MSEFDEAIGWRGPHHRTFIVYGIWKAEDGCRSAMERAEEALTGIVPGSRVFLYVAADEGWPCNVGVFNIDFAAWPEDREAACVQLLAAVCREGPELAWMMFEGMFNDVRDIFAPGWARHIYAIQGDCRSRDAELAIDDEERHSAGWLTLVAKHRARVLSLFPTLLDLEFE